MSHLDIDHKSELSRGITRYGNVHNAHPERLVCDDDYVKRNPGKVDEGLWEKAKAKVEKEYGELRWPVVTHVYEAMGGKFN